MKYLLLIIILTLTGCTAIATINEDGSMKITGPMGSKANFENGSSIEMGSILPEFPVMR